MSPSMVCQFRISERTIIGVESMREPSTFFERKGTDHYDGLYRIHHVEWNDHATRHEAVYLPADWKEA